ncbi:MAG TPA: formate acetyltransferase [Candidatus Gallacutalibacter stercoravium]|nr:formate acetyltransferase [Candidatus Gallacutalibacter stercoravium]
MLTYRERTKKMMEVKLRHTMEKKAQQGYMDADDYGCIPLPKDYHFDIIPNEGYDFFFGPMGCARNLAKMLDEIPVYVDPMEIMCGRWSDMMSKYRYIGGGKKTGGKSTISILYPYDDLVEDQIKYGLNPGIGAENHCACDYNIGIELGFGGLLEKIRRYRDINPNRKEFYDAEELVVLSIQKFIQRHIDKIEELLKTEERPEIRETLQEMLECNRNIKTEPPKTFLEACQFIAWINTVSRTYDRDGAGCSLDVILYPFYVDDVKKGILDDEKATFILADLLLIETHYYQLSGPDSCDRDLTNKVSYLVLDAAHWLNTSANITIRLHDNIDPKFLRKAVEYLFTDRNAWPRFSGDKGLMGYTKNKHITKKIARDRIAVGCHWMAVPGKEYSLNDCVKINVAKVFDIAFHEMMDDKSQEPSMDRLLAIMQKHLTKAVETIAKGLNHHMTYQQYVNPEIVMNLMMHNSIETGLDITACAEIQGMCVDGVGLGLIADSLAAIEQRVINEKKLTWEELDELLKSDFEGVQGERMRLMLKSSERYCQGNSLGDKWAAYISKMFADTVKAQPMPGIRELVPGWFSWSNTIAFGKEVGATPDGRKAGTPVTHGANPNPGFRADGAATAMATGIARIQTGYGNTCPLQLEMDPKLGVQEGGIDKFIQLLKTHVDMGGTLVNVNILDHDKLMEAHKDPSTHPELVVRVTGFTAYFATLSPEFRQLVVDRFVDGF